MFEIPVCTGEGVASIVFKMVEIFIASVGEGDVAVEGGLGRKDVALGRTVGFKEVAKYPGLESMTGFVLAKAVCELAGFDGETEAGFSGAGDE